MYLNSYRDISAALTDMSSAALIYSNLAKRYAGNMDTVSKIRVDRLNALIKEMGGTRLFCEKIERSEAQVYQWINQLADSKSGKPRSISNASARRIESICGKPVGWLDQPIKSNEESNIEEIHKHEYANVPLISWVQAGSWNEAVDNFHPGDAEEWLPCPTCHSDKTFALRVRGISMYNPEGDESFREGEIIYIDPMRLPIHGSLVVARTVDSNEVTFKKLIVEGNKKYLYALNPDWKNRIIEIDHNIIICGVLVFSGRRY